MGHVRNDVARGLGKHKVPGKARSHDLCLRDMFAGSPGSDSYLVTAVIDEIDGRVLAPHPLENVVAVMAIQDNHGPLVHDDRVLDHAVPHQIALDSHQVLVQNLLVLPQGVYGYQCYCCLLYTSDAADDLLCVDLGGRRIIKKKKKKKK